MPRVGRVALGEPGSPRRGGAGVNGLAAVGYFPAPLAQLTAAAIFPPGKF